VSMSKEEVQRLLGKYSQLDSRGRAYMIGSVDGALAMQKIYGAVQKVPSQPVAKRPAMAAVK
jgi:hypothetical protein